MDLILDVMTAPLPIPIGLAIGFLLMVYGLYCGVRDLTSEVSWRWTRRQMKRETQARIAQFRKS